MIDFLNFVGFFAFIVIGVAIWHPVLKRSLAFALLWPALWIVATGYFQLVENIDPNWCEKQMNGPVYSSNSDHDELEGRCF